MKREYDAIAKAGFIVQLDSPDLRARSNNYPDMELAEWRKIVERNVEAVAYATRDIPEDQVRVHVCWGCQRGSAQLRHPAPGTSSTCCSSCAPST